MDENEFTADEAEKINQWGRKTLAEARLKEAAIIEKVYPFDTEIGNRQGSPPEP